MNQLFGRFPHLVEDIFGLLKAETLFCCSQINKTWNENLEDYRIHLVKKIQRHLKDPSIVYGRTPNFDQFEGQNLPKILLENMREYPTYGPTRIRGPPKPLKRIIMIDLLPLPFLVHFLRYFCDHRIKDCEVNFRISSITQSSVDLGVFVKSESNGEEVNEHIGSIGQFRRLFGPCNYLSIPGPNKKAYTAERCKKAYTSQKV
jgi:hypothetical protein